MVIQTGSESMNITISRFRSREEEKGNISTFIMTMLGLHSRGLP